MSIQLMYITNRPEIATIAENAGVDRIFVDMEYIGKQDRQGGMDTVQSHHTPKDVQKIKQTVKKASVMCRVNPIHEATAAYGSSKEEIDEAIAAGADILMLPYFKTTQEVETFLSLVDNRAKTLPLVETPEAVSAIDDILDLSGIDEIYVGLNDLSLGYGKKFMFELLTDGTVESLARKFNEKNLPFGFGGIAAPGLGMLPAEYIIREHYRLGSTCAILSRSFCNTEKVTDLQEVKTIFDQGVAAIRAVENECEQHRSFFTENRKIIEQKVQAISNQKM